MESLFQPPRLEPFLGMRIIEDRNMVERKQVRFPRSKKRRIRKKWSKRTENFRSIPRKEVFFLMQQNMAVMHPSVARELIAMLQVTAH